MSRQTHPLLIFAKAVSDARSKFIPGNCSSWLTFYDAKQKAYIELVSAIPAVAEIENFWRLVQTKPQRSWLSIVAAEMDHILRERSCADCGAEVTFPKKRCDHCQSTRRQQQNRAAQQRIALRQRQRKCSRCNIEPLTPRQRVCATCKTQARIERNQRHQESLKGAPVRRVRLKFTREENSAKVGLRPTTRPSVFAEREGVLTAESAT